ncbi:Glutathione S-transferase [Quillaja saponaria]|uniref:glutathione transferase n=1 Tax=Quillaja saponaria TaxID=32244 RepID=A0AAD7LNR4_QUISA|nr:Glutathione S-transferase [Quillaja saponaria]
MAAELEEVKLFGVWGSPFSRRVDIALKLKGVQYSYFEENLDDKSALLLKYNPIHKKVPVLVHNEKPVAESLIILEYIDETWKDNPFLPNDPYERAIARFWARFIEDKCMPALWKALWSNEEERDKAAEEASELLQILENELKDKKFFGGETVGLVDIAADFIGFWLGVFQEIVGLRLLTNEKLPKLYKWTQEFANHSVIKENLPPKDKLHAFFKGAIEGLAASK